MFRALHNTPNSESSLLVTGSMTAPDLSSSVLRVGHRSPTFRTRRGVSSTSPSSCKEHVLLSATAIFLCCLSSPGPRLPKP